MPRRSAVRVVVGALAASTLSSLAGCTALGVSVAGLGGAMVGASAGAAVKAGTEYQLGGTVVRTFAVSLPRVRQAALRTFERLDIEARDRGDGRTGAAPADSLDSRLEGRARRRTVTLRFEAVTDVLTRVRVTVKRSFLIKDVATADELLAQLDATLDAMGDEQEETTAAAPLPTSRPGP